MTKNGATGWLLRASHALIAISPPMPAGSPIVRQSGGESAMCRSSEADLNPDVDEAG